ncbi:hypothetical protein GCM10027037_20350 [Mucilaginibacter koreensis]
MKPRIELSKPRDFGEVVNDTFTFIKQNFKPLMSCFFTFCGFFLLGSVVAASLQQIRMADALNNASAYGTETPTIFSNLGVIGVEYVVTVIFVILTYMMLLVTILSYMHLYKDKGSVPPTTAEVWAYIKYFFWRVLAAGLLLTVAMGLVFGLFMLFGYGSRSLSLIIFGGLVCFGLAFWIYPIASVMFPIIVIENGSIGYAMRQSFRLVKGNWWVTFGTLFVIGLITAACAGLVALPLAVANAISMVFSIKNGVGTFNKTLMVATAVVQHIAYVFYIIPVVAAALCYFNLTEVKEGTGMLSRINKFGMADDAESKNSGIEEY